MKKILISILLTLTIIHAGPVAEEIKQINKIDNSNLRIEFKLDMLLEKLVDAEKRQEEQDRAVQEAASKVNGWYSKVKLKFCDNNSTK